MVQNPEVLLRAQGEMDRVIGGERLPGFDDRANLPYRIVHVALLIDGC